VRSSIGIWTERYSKEVVTSSRIARDISLSLLFLACAGLAYAQSQAGSVNATTDEQQMEVARKLLSQQYAWDQGAAVGVTRLIFKERDRKKTDQGTVITYDVSAPGLPTDLHYTLLAWPLNRGIEPIRSGIALTADARLTCTGKTPADCKPEADPIISLAVQAARGEAKRFLLISDDKKAKALGTIVAFPIFGKDAGCSLEVLLGTPDGQIAMVKGSGFAPNISIPISSDSAGEVVTGTWKVDDKGNLMSSVFPQVRGKTSGETTILVQGPGCSPKVSFRWGKDSYHVE
jgi:hypothetical protein